MIYMGISVILLAVSNFILLKTVQKLRKRPPKDVYITLPRSEIGKS